MLLLKSVHVMKLSLNLKSVQIKAEISGEPKPKEPTTQSTLWVQQEREQQLLQGTSMSIEY